MAIFSMAQRTSVTTSTSAAFEIVAGANNAYRLLEIGLTINAATASVFAFGTPLAKGVTPANGAIVLAEDTGNTTAGVTSCATTWATSPTAATAGWLRRVSTPATAGAGIVWTFPRGRTTLKTATDALYNITTNSVIDVWFVVDE